MLIRDDVPLIFSQEAAVPMTGVTAPARKFRHKKRRAQALAEAMMRWEGVPAIPLFLDNTAALVLISEAPDGGWDLGGYAFANAEIAETARPSEHAMSQERAIEDADLTSRPAP